MKKENNDVYNINSNNWWVIERVGTYPLLPSAKRKHILYRILYRIMLIITERWVLKRVAKLRNRLIKKETRKLSSEQANKCLIRRKVRGVERDIFMDYIMFNEDKPITWWRIKFFPVLNLLNFYKGGKRVRVINDILDEALRVGYLYDPYYCKDETFPRLKLTKKGYRYISPLHYIRAFYNNKHTQQIISMTINWGVPLLAFWVATHFLNINITPK